MTHTGLRYPKPAWISTHITGGAAGIETIGGTTHYKSNRQNGCIVAPARYTQVRKVRFYVTIRNQDTNSDLNNARLRIWGASSGGVANAPEVRTITPGAASATYYTLSSIVNRCFARFGTAGTVLRVPGGVYAASASLLEIEFDRFSGQDDDFFQAWDSADDADEYIQFHPAIAADGTANGTSGPLPPEVDYFAFGCVVVQAPFVQNNSCTYVQVWRPVQEDASGPIIFDSAVVTASAQVRGAWRFRYNASDWDNITSVHLLVLGQKTTLGGGFDIRFTRMVSNTQGTASTTTLLSASPLFPNQNEFGWWRSADLLSLLVDGADFTFDYRNAGGLGQGEVMAFLEIIQQNHTKTVSYHHANPSAVQANNGLTSGTTPQIAQGGFLFDPTFFANYPQALILKQNIVGQINHRGPTLDPEYHLCLNSDLDEDQNGPSGVTPTTFVVTPTVSPPTNEAATWYYADTVMLANDPINLAGARKFFVRMESGFISASVPESPGSMALMYALSVPNTEVLELGDLFPLTAFNQEGCASTAAGLGDPGVLVITNGSTIPQKFNPEAGTVGEAGIPEPFPDEFPSQAGGTISVASDTSVSPCDSLGIGLYVYRYTFRDVCTGKESNPNPDDIIVDTTGASPGAVVTLSFAGIRIPSLESTVTEICVYRTVLGGAFPVLAKVGCFNFNTTTVFVDGLGDACLDFANEPLSELNAPPPCAPYIVDFKNRLWLAGDIPDLSPAGTVTAVLGSDIITGSDEVVWDRCLDGKSIQLQGDCRSYEILRVLPPPVGTSPPINRLQLVDEYEGVSQTGALYTICGRPSRLYFSEPFEAEYWPEINFIDVEPGDGDRITGLASNFNRLVVCKRNKTYVVTFAENPVTEGTEATRISSDIGCIAPRSFAQVENGTVWLAERGLALFDGRGVQHVPESVEMNQIFIDPDNENYVRRDVNGRVIGAVGVYYAKREQYLLLLPSSRTTRGADMMLVWNVKLRNITLLQFCQEFASMVVGKDSDGNDRVYLGDTNGFVWIYDVGFVDGVGTPGATGTVRGVVTASGVDPDTGASFVDDSTASFIEGGLPGLAGLSGIAGLSGAFSGAPGDNLGIAGVCVFVRAVDAALDDPWESRVVFAATSTRLYVTPGIASLGDLTGFEYMLGPIDFDARFKPNNYGSDDNSKRHWKHKLTFVPQDEASRLRVEVKVDLADTDDLELEVASGEPTFQGGPPETGGGRLFDMSQRKGKLVATMPRRIHNFFDIRLSNFAPEEPIEILNHITCFEVQEGK